MTRLRDRRLDAHGDAQPHRHLYLEVLVGIVLGIAVGYRWPGFATQLKPLGDAFIRLIKMMIPAIVFCTVAGGFTALGGVRETGRTLVKALGLFYALTAVALLIGIAAVYIAKPGAGLHIDVSSVDVSALAQYTKQIPSHDVVGFLLQLIPNTFFAAFTEGEVLPVLLVAVLFGFALAKVGLRGGPIARGLDSLSAVVFAIFGMLVRLAPIGAFGATAFTVGRYGLRSIESLGLLVATFYAAGLFFVVVVLGVLSRLHGFSLWKLLRYTREETLVVLGTSSIEPVLPRLLVKLEKLGCNRGVVGLVLPAGYSFNLVGTAIYLSLATVFIAQATNVHLSVGRLAILLLVMLLTSKGAAGVSGSGFVALVATLSVLRDVPVAGAAIILGVDRFMSEARALTSNACNTVAVVIVSIWEGACDRAVLARELDRGSAPADAAVLPEEGVAQAVPR